MKRIAAVAVTLSLLATPVAMAGDRDHHRGGGRDHPHHVVHGRHVHDRHVHVKEHHRPRFHAGAYHAPPGYRHHYWKRGGRLPRAYYAPRYVIHHHHVYHLRPPPRGYHWVRVGNDAVLAAVATGLIMEVIHHHFY